MPWASLGNFYHAILPAAIVRSITLLGGYCIGLIYEDSLAHSISPDLFLRQRSTNESWLHDGSNEEKAILSSPFEQNDGWTVCAFRVSVKGFFCIIPSLAAGPLLPSIIDQNTIVHHLGHGFHPFPCLFSGRGTGPFIDFLHIETGESDKFYQRPKGPAVGKGKSHYRLPMHSSFSLAVSLRLSFDFYQGLALSLLIQCGSIVRKYVCFFWPWIILKF